MTLTKQDGQDILDLHKSTLEKLQLGKLRLVNYLNNLALRESRNRRETEMSLEKLARDIEEELRTVRRWEAFVAIEERADNRCHLCVSWDKEHDSCYNNKINYPGCAEIIS